MKITKEFLEDKIEEAKTTKKNLEKKKELRIQLSVKGLIIFCDETIMICEELLKCIK